MRGDLHDDGVHPSCAHLRKQLLHHNDIRGRIRCRKDLILHHDLDRSNQPDTFSCMVQNCTREIARRRLAVCPRNADDTHAACGVVIEIRHDRIQRLLEIGYMKNGDACRHLHPLPLRQNSAGTSPRHIRYKAVRIHMSARDTGKERSLLHPPRVPLNARNHGVTALKARTRQKISEFLQSLRHAPHSPSCEKYIFCGTRIPSSSTAIASMRAGDFSCAISILRRSFSCSSCSASCCVSSRV